MTLTQINPAGRDPRIVPMAITGLLETLVRTARPHYRKETALAGEGRLAKKDSGRHCKTLPDCPVV